MFKKKKIILLAGIYLVFLAITFIIVRVVNYSSDHTLPYLYHYLTESEEQRDIGNYRVTMTGCDYYPETGTAYAVLEITSADNSKLTDSGTEYGIVNSLDFKKDFDGYFYVSKCIVKKNTASVAMFFQYNKLDEVPSVADFCLTDGENSAVFSINEKENPVSLTVSTKEAGEITFYEACVIFRYEDSAPSIESLKLTYKDSTTKYVADNDIVNTVYDTDSELIFILDRPIDLTNANGCIINDVEYTVDSQ